MDYDAAVCTAVDLNAPVIFPYCRYGVKSDTDDLPPTRSDICLPFALQVAVA